MALKENYKDDILDTSQNVKRKYRMTENPDGTISLDDETEYLQEGDSFGASDMNAVNSEVNEVVNNLGAKNMLPNNATSQVIAGITYTINSDGSITISGTSTASNGIVLSSNQLLHKGTYKTTTGQTQEEDSDAFIYVQDTNTQRVISRSNDLEVPSQFTLANDTLVNYGVWVDVGKTVNVTIYPMVRPASIADDTYAPYAQTNKELTDNLTASNQTAGVTDVPFRFGCTDDGKFGYIINQGGADSVIPFSSKDLATVIDTNNITGAERAVINPISVYDNKHFSINNNVLTCLKACDVIVWMKGNTSSSSGGGQMYVTKNNSNIFMFNINANIVQSGVFVSLNVGDTLSTYTKKTSSSSQFARGLGGYIVVVNH